MAFAAKCGFVLLLFSGFLTGCSSDEAELNADEIELLKEINQAQENTMISLDLLETGSKITSDGTLPNEKATKMVGILRAEDCPVSGTMPGGEKYSSSWTKRFEVTSASCPVIYRMYQEYDASTRVWRMNEVLNVQGDEFSKLSGLVKKSVSGSLEARVSGARTLIEGEIEIQNLQLENDLPSIRGSISTQQQYHGDSGGGRLILNMEVSGRIYTAEVEWDVSGSRRTYKVQKKKVEREEFQSLFSSFKLVEIVDRSLKMR